MIKAIGKKDAVYKEQAIIYLKSIEDFKGFQEKYNDFVLRAYNKLVKDAEDIDYKLEKEFIRLNAENNDPKVKKTKASKEKLKVVNERFDNHRDMLEGMRTWDIMEEINSTRLTAFKDKHINKVYLMYTNGKTEVDIVNFLEYYLADLYHKQIKK